MIEQLKREKLSINKKFILKKKTETLKFVIFFISF